MVSWIVRLLLIAAGAITEWFVAADAPNFGVVQGVIAVLLLTVVVFVLAFWPKSWSHRLNRAGNKS